MPQAGHSENRVSVYIDFDSCYYNIARRLYKIVPWTIIINRFNHIISVPYWLEGHFGVKKIAYLAPPARVRLKVKHFVRVFNVDVVPNGRNNMTEFLANILEGVKAFVPDASIIHKDSIVAEVECFSMGKVKSAVVLPCTIGIGCSVEEAKNDCKVKKIAKGGHFTNVITFMLYAVPMAVSYLLYLLRRKTHDNYEVLYNARSTGVQ